MTEDPRLIMARAVKAREEGPTPEQKHLRAIVDHRNAVMQERGVRPKDGITFAASKKERRAS